MATLSQCANYFCGVLSETYPNRLVLYSGTSGGNTSNDINNGTLNYPSVLDLLSAHSITFKNYNFHCPSNCSILALFKKWATGGPHNELNGAPFPPRDGNAAISDLTQCFTFG
jgi:phospholipase C